MKLKVILTKDVKNIGTKNSVLDVSSGLAYNKLIPSKEAILATPSNLKKMEAKIKAQNKDLLEQQNKATQLKKTIEENEFVFELETHHGKAIGTITSAMLINQINEKCGTQIDKKKVKLEHISNIGSYLGTIHLFKGIDANARVIVMEKKNANN